MYIDFKHGLPESIIEFRDIIIDNFIEEFRDKFQLEEKNNINYKPNVIASNSPPNENQNWNKVDLSFNEDSILYYKEEDKLYFYIQINLNLPTIKSKINVHVLIMNCLIITNILKYNILFIHGGVLNNGDIFFGPCQVGKTTLLQRINNCNDNLRAICSDNNIINLDEMTIYSFSYKWQYDWLAPLEQENISISFHNIYELQQKPREMMFKGNINEWKTQLIKGITRILCVDPFGITRTEDDENRNWVSHIPKLKYKLDSRIIFLVNEFIKNNNIEPIIITTNTSSLYTKYKVLLDTTYEYSDSICKFDQTVNILNIRELILQFNILFNNYFLRFQIPHLNISAFPPKDKNIWQKYSCNNEYIIYYKNIDNQDYFYLQILYIDNSNINKMKLLILNFLYITFLLNGEKILYFNTFILNYGILLFNDNNIKKEFLNEKIKNILNLEIKDNDIIILNLANKKFFIPFKENSDTVKKCYYLTSNENQSQKVFKMEEKECKNKIMDISKVFLNNFQLSSKDKKDKLWSEFNLKIKEKIQKKIEEIITYNFVFDFQCLNIENQKYN